MNELIRQNYFMNMWKSSSLEEFMTRHNLAKTIEYSVFKSGVILVLTRGDYHSFQMVWYGMIIIEALAA